jgi:hypothetical protein
MPQAIPASNPQIASVQQAAEAIVALINASPRSPRIEEIEAVIAKCVPSNAVASPAPTPPLLAKIRDAARRLEETFDVYGKIRPGDPNEDTVTAKLDQIQAELEDLEGKIPSPPRSFVDLVAWAEIARAGAGIHKDGTIAETQEDDVFQRPAARLMEAVLQMGACGHGPPPMSPAHAAHYRELRRLIDEHMREFENRDQTGMTMAESDADDARMSAHTSVIDALVERIFAVPARTWGDVMLYAQACSWEYWAGADPEGPSMRRWLDDGPQCDHDDSIALAKLLEATFSVAGIGQFAEARHA